MRRIVIEIEDNIPEDYALKLVTKVVEKGKVFENSRGYPAYKGTTLFKGNCRVVRGKSNNNYIDKFQVDKYLISVGDDSI